MRAAETQYLAALQLQPDLGVAAVNLGVLYFNVDRLDAAEYWLTRALTDTPMLADGYANLGALRLAQGRRSEALLLLLQAQQLVVNNNSLQVLISRNLALLQ